MKSSTWDLITIQQLCIYDEGNDFKSILHKSVQNIPLGFIQTIRCFRTTMIHVYTQSTQSFKTVTSENPPPLN